MLSIPKQNRSYHNYSQNIRSLLFLLLVLPSVLLEPRRSTLVTAFSMTTTTTTKTPLKEQTMPLIVHRVPSQQSNIDLLNQSLWQLHAATPSNEMIHTDNESSSSAVDEFKSSNITMRTVLSTIAVVAVAVTALNTPAAFAAADVTTSTTEILNKFTSTGFYQAFSLVFISEIGDKTFFMAGLLAMKTSKLTSFIGSMAALAVMTVLSVLLGQVFHIVPSISNFGGIPLDDVAAVLAFAFFGIKTLQESLAMPDDVSSDDDSSASKPTSVMDEELEDAKETVASAKLVTNQKLAQLGSIFGLVFAAEFGDRSFLSTIALSAAQNPIAVAGGAIVAHGNATGIAVTSGSVVAKYLSEKVIGIIGGTLFIVFAVTTAFGIF